MVAIPKKMQTPSSKGRRYFEKKSEALRYAAMMRERYHTGERGGGISHELAVMAVTGQALLEPYGLTLIEAVKIAVEKLAATTSPETLRERHAAAMLEGEAHWSAIYARDMEKIPKWLGKDVMVTRCAVLTPEILRDALGAGGARARSTLDHRMRYVMAVINFRPRHRKAASISIMSATQVRKFILSGVSTPERMAAAVLIFAGVRPDAEDGEISRLDWEAFSESEIYMSDAITKTGTDRRIPISRRLARIIKGHPASGPVMPANWRRAYKRMRKAAGIKMEHDITRHTFASNFLAAYGEHAAKQAMGHTANSSTLFRHYRRAISEEAGKLFFEGKMGL
jgi:integrase